MRKLLLFALPVTLFWACGAVSADDLYEAHEAFQKQDLPRAFALYRRLAELGHGDSQEMVAAMYVNAEGVLRDNVLGYAWASLALEQGESEVSRSIVTQLQSRLKPDSLARVAEIRAQFGGDALREKLLPVKQVSNWFDRLCKITNPANPDFYYPEHARSNRIQGMALVFAPVLPDGSVRNPQVWFSFPVGEFEQTSRAVALQSQYRNSAPAGESCTMLYKVEYSMRLPSNDFSKEAAKLKVLANKGDPRSQLAYAILLAVNPKLNTEREDPTDWFLKAAQAGLSSGQYMLAWHFDAGAGVVRDESKARRWFEMAAAGGSSSAMISLASHELRNKNDAAARARGFDLMTRAAAAGNWLAQFYLAAMLASDSSAPWHNAKQALQIIERLTGGFDYDPAVFEIRAAAYASLGNFERATYFQNRAIREARHIKWNLAAMQARLALYESGKTWNGELIEF